MAAPAHDLRHPVERPAERTGRGLAGRVRASGWRSSGGARGYSRRAVGPAGRRRCGCCRPATSPRRLDSGELHLGVTGEDLLRERGDDMDARVMLLRAWASVARTWWSTAPKSWLRRRHHGRHRRGGVTLYLAKTGRRLRVATKYVTQTRPSSPVTAWPTTGSCREQRAPPRGAGGRRGAELVVDITTTGATLAANGLKIPNDGVILKSQRSTDGFADHAVDGGPDRPCWPVCWRWSRPRAGRLSWPPWSGRTAEQAGAGRAPSPCSSARARGGPTAHRWRRLTMFQAAAASGRPESSRSPSRVLIYVFEVAIGGPGPASRSAWLGKFGLSCRT